MIAPLTFLLSFTIVMTVLLVFVAFNDCLMIVIFGDVIILIEARCCIVGVTKVV